MLSSIKKLFFISLLISISACSGKMIKDTGLAKNTVNNFFDKCYNDANEASFVISEKRLISALSHLNRMNNGGSYYYVLEKDATTKMLNSLTTYNYSECLLINTSGKIVYTMHDDKLLGKSVFAIPGKPFNSIVEKSLNGNSMVSDTIIYETKNNNFDNVIFSIPVKEKGKFMGVLLTLVPTYYLKEELPPNTYIVDTDGIIKYHPIREKNNSVDNHFFKKNNENKVKFNSQIITYNKIIFRSINWYIAIIN